MLLLLLYSLRSRDSCRLVVSKSKAVLSCTSRPWSPEPKPSALNLPTRPWSQCFQTCLAHNSVFSVILPRSTDTNPTNMSTSHCPCSDERSQQGRGGPAASLGGLCRSHSSPGPQLGLVPSSLTLEPGLFLLGFSSTLLGRRTLYSP